MLDPRVWRMGEPEMLTIGEFAKLSNVSTQTLRHYDRIGLLKPSHVDFANQYRLYSINQLEKMQTIRSLKHIGYQLRDIQMFFNEYSLDKMIHMLDFQVEELDREIQHLTRLKMQSERKSAILKDAADESGLNRIAVRDIEERYLVRKRIKYSNLDEIFAMEFGKMISNLKDEDRFFPVFGVAFPKEPFILQQPFGDVALFMLADSETESAVWLDAGRYVTLLHQGSYSSISQRYEELILFMNREGYEATGDILELGLVDPYIADDEEQFITEIQIPVRKIQPEKT